MPDDTEQPNPSVVPPPQNPDEQPSTTGLVADDEAAEVEDDAPR